MARPVGRPDAAWAAVGLIAAGLMMWLAAGAGVALPQSPAQTSQTCDAAGSWSASPIGVWVRRVVEVAGYRTDGCTDRAWTAASARARFLIWATERWRPPGGLRPYTQALPFPAFTDGLRVVWAAQGLGIWIEPGPDGSDAPPGRRALASLQVASRGLPRRYEQIPFMPTPRAALRACRSDVGLAAACPARIPRVPLSPRVLGWRTYPKYPRIVDGLFGMQLGGEIPGRPELQRPPNTLHIEVTVDRPPRRLRFSWPRGGAIKARDGLMREDRARPVYLGRVTWARKAGTLVLAPPYPRGGSQGNHVVFRWRSGGVAYIVGMHAWEPFTEAVATLRRIVNSLPR